ncbi:MAG: hypothetical protein RRY99_16355 [Flavobacterium sp.]
MLDTKKLKIRMLELNKRPAEIAEYLKINTTTFYRKTNGTSEFDRSEMEKLNEILLLEDPTEIFFAKDITQTQKNEL